MGNEDERFESDYVEPRIQERPTRSEVGNSAYVWGIVGFVVISIIMGGFAAVIWPIGAEEAMPDHDVLSDSSEAAQTSEADTSGTEP
jgi:hypothetical protein